jgi:pSer/pThr/pTyr-binding forkhead associated (FHA) protein
MRALELEIQLPSEQAPRLVTFSNSPVRLGRSPLNDVTLALGFVSEWHGVIRFDESSTRYLDLGSTNGTVIAGQRVPKDQPVDLVDGAVVTIGPILLRVRRLDSKAPVGSSTSLASDRKSTATPPAPTLQTGAPGRRRATPVVSQPVSVAQEPPTEPVSPSAEPVPPSAASPDPPAVAPEPHRGSSPGALPSIFIPAPGKKPTGGGKASAPDMGALPTIFPQVGQVIEHPVRPSPLPSVARPRVRTDPQPHSVGDPPTTPRPDERADPAPAGRERAAAAGSLVVPTPAVSTGDEAAPRPRPVAPAEPAPPVGGTRAMSRSEFDAKRTDPRQAALLKVFCEGLLSLRKGYEEMGNQLGIRPLRGTSQLLRARRPEDLKNHLLDPGASAAEREAELREIFANMSVHHLAILEAFSEGARVLLTTLDPEGGDESLRTSRLLPRRGRSKTHVLERLRELLASEEDLHGTLFGPEFAASYAEALKKRS